MAKRTLSEEEETLWRQAMQSATPLPKSKQAMLKKAPARSPRVAQNKTGTPMPVPDSNVPAVKLGNFVGIDRGTATRFAKGERIDATLDLHGLSREKAYASLLEFINHQYQRGARRLLIITGKGVRSGAPGILREALPHWLANMPFQPIILGLAVAQAKHGGTGAYYVLLKKKRSTE